MADKVFFDVEKSQEWQNRIKALKDETEKVMENIQKELKVYADASEGDYGDQYLTAVSDLRPHVNSVLVSVNELAMKVNEVKENFGELINAVHEKIHNSLNDFIDEIEL